MKKIAAMLITAAAMTAAITAAADENSAAYTG